MGEMKDRMLRGELYIADDPDLIADNARAQELLDRYNATRDDEQAERDRLLRELLGGVGAGVMVKPSFRCDYGGHITIGDGTFVNYDCVMLDVARDRDRRPLPARAARPAARPPPTPSTPGRAATAGSPVPRSRSPTTSGSAAAPSSAPG